LLRNRLLISRFLFSCGRVVPRVERVS